MCLVWTRKSSWGQTAVGKWLILGGKCLGGFWLQAHKTLKWPFYLLSRSLETWASSIHHYCSNNAASSSSSSPPYVTNALFWRSNWSFKTQSFLMRSCKRAHIPKWKQPFYFWKLLPEFRMLVYGTRRQRCISKSTKKTFRLSQFMWNIQGTTTKQHTYIFFQSHRYLTE